VSLLVAGSVALDTVETPYGKAEEVLGGSATFFAVAASYFTDVRLVAVVGDDFDDRHRDFLLAKGIDLEGLETVPGKTFRWAGRYSPSMNERETLELALNVSAEHEPVVPERYKDSEFLFLANNSPKMQCRVMDQLPGAKLAVCDTMNHWIVEEREGVEAVFGRVQGVVLNDEEARLFTDDYNLPRATRKMLGCGPDFIVVKKGEHGSFMASRDGLFSLAAYPTEDVRDPTGAGDSFAGAMMGYLARHNRIDFETLKEALVCATVMASIVVEQFSLNCFDDLTSDKFEQRRQEFLDMMRI